MRNPLRRHYGRGDLHFVTFSCYRRRPFLGTRHARDRFVRVLNEVRSRHAFKLLGYVVMPEHVHAKKDGEINSPLQKRKDYCGPVR
jgi:putative transposase